MDRLRHILAPLIGLLLFGVAIFALHDELTKYSLREIVADLCALPGRSVGLALGLTAINYWTLTGYDTLGVRYLGNPLPYPRIALASFVGYSMSHNLGFVFSAVRYRLYSTWGLSALDIAKIVGLNGFTFWLGFLALIGCTLLGSAPPAALPLSPAAGRVIGAGCLAAVAAYLMTCATRRAPVRWRLWKIALPSSRQSFAQLALSVADWTLVASVLYVLLPAAPELSFPKFLTVFLLAQLAGLLSQVPGGLGVFDTAIVLLLKPYASGVAVLGSILAFRGIYYLIPLLVATLLLGGHEVLGRRRPAVA